MDLTQLANLGEFIGGVAVLVTLIYLAVQVRQTNKTISASAFHGITGHVLALHSLLLQDREMADLTVRGRSGLENLDEVERLRFGLGASAVLHVTNDIFEYYRTGLMKQSQWNNWEHIVAQNAARDTATIGPTTRVSTLRASKRMCRASSKRCRPAVEKDRREKRSAAAWSDLSGSRLSAATNVLPEFVHPGAVGAVFLLDPRERFQLLRDEPIAREGSLGSRTLVEHQNTLANRSVVFVHFGTERAVIASDLNELRGFSENVSNPTSDPSRLVDG
jgi:hypothetical protein